MRDGDDRGSATPGPRASLGAELGKFRELQRIGEHRSALGALHRCWDRGSLEASERGTLAALLSCEYARLQCLDEARGWLRLAMGLRQRKSDRVLLHACEQAQLVLRLHEGRYHDAIIVGVRLAGRGRPHDAAEAEHVQRIRCLTAQAYLQLDCFDGCEALVGRILEVDSGAPPRVIVEALLLRGESRIWRYMLASVEGRLEGSERVASFGAGLDPWVEAAGRDFDQAALVPEEDRATVDALRTWHAIVRVLRSFNYMDLQVIGSYVDGLARLGRRRERDRLRVVIAFLHLLRGRYELTKGWSRSMALSADDDPGEDCPGGALLVFAAACKGLGDEALAGRCHGSYKRRRAQQRLIQPQVTLRVCGQEQRDGDLQRVRHSGAELLAERRARLVAQAIGYVQDAVDGPRHVDVVCEALGVSRRTLEMAFRAITGQSPKRYFDSLRAREAIRHLREFSGPASRRARYASCAAQKAGFSSYRSFHRAFMHLYGVSPVLAMANPDVLGPAPESAQAGLDAVPDTGT